eukprot:gnl/MRDRNA2_/MRDRNA2_78899_c0_seq2.p1 gnl/MRDRNA2_/MRDRNA2_78899_c0~~gnl/MRDRNA2_/MRDRNA2_78899_c0_seq2.p1  ORF type:complete len:191 (+),score=31.75 gnl/MRDRNA2_/MRDRNA2_78899_c0_seq2:326-898(+)
MVAGKCLQVHAGQSAVGMQLDSISTLQPDALSDPSPYFSIQLLEITVVFKPVGWAIGSEDGIATHLCFLSSFIQGHVPISIDQGSLAHRAELDFGFLHRLDAPCSGMLLHAWSGRGYAALRWQLDAHDVRREYCVLGVSVLQAGMALTSVAVEKMGMRQQRHQRFACSQGRHALSMISSLAALVGDLEWL